MQNSQIAAKDSDACHRDIHLGMQIDPHTIGAAPIGRRSRWRSPGLRLESAMTPVDDSFSGLKAPQTHRVRKLSLLALALSDAIRIDCKSAQIVA